MGRWLLFIGLAVGLTRTHAEAQEPADDDGTTEAEAPGPMLPPEVEAEARSRFDLGESLYHQGRFDEALVEFERAHELTGRPAFLYNIYLCHRDAGNAREALEALTAYLDESDDVPTRGLLERRRDTLEAQIAAEVDAEQRAEDAARAAEDAERRVEEERARRGAVDEPNRLGPGLLLGGGGAVLLAGAGLGISALFLHDELESECFGSACPPWKHDEVQSLRRRTIAFDVLMGVGAAVVLTGLVWWLVGGGGNGDARARVGCGPTGCRLEGTF